MPDTCCPSSLIPYPLQGAFSGIKKCKLACLTPYCPPVPIPYRLRGSLSDIQKRILVCLKLPVPRPASPIPCRVRYRIRGIKKILWHARHLPFPIPYPLQGRCLVHKIYFGVPDTHCLPSPIPCRARFFIPGIWYLVRVYQMFFGVPDTYCPPSPIPFPLQGALSAFKKCMLTWLAPTVPVPHPLSACRVRYLLRHKNVLWCVGHILPPGPHPLPPAWRAIIKNVLWRACHSLSPVPYIPCRVRYASDIEKHLIVPDTHCPQSPIPCVILYILGIQKIFWRG